MLHRDLAYLTPQTREMAKEFLDKCKEHDFTVVVTETLREPETQAVYFLRGRIPDTYENRKVLQELGAKYAWRFSDLECAKKVTWTLDSNHLDGNALDIAIYKDGYVLWDFSDPLWRDVLRIAKEVGFECGADWPENDFPHLQNPNKGGP